MPYQVSAWAVRKKEANWVSPIPLENEFLLSSGCADFNISAQNPASSFSAAARKGSDALALGILCGPDGTACWRTSLAIITPILSLRFFLFLR